MPVVPAEVAGAARAASILVLGAAGGVNGAILPDAFKALVAADLADQVAQLHIAPPYIDTEELSRLRLHLAHRASASRSSRSSASSYG